MVNIRLTREQIIQLRAEPWIELEQYVSHWDRDRDCIQWRIPRADWTWLVLKYPQLGVAEQS